MHPVNSLFEFEVAPTSPLGKLVPWTSWHTCTVALLTRLNTLVLCVNARLNMNVPLTVWTWNCSQTYGQLSYCMQYASGTQDGVQLLVCQAIWGAIVNEGCSWKQLLVLLISVTLHNNTLCDEQVRTWPLFPIKTHLLALGDFVFKIKYNHFVMLWSRKLTFVYI